VVGGAGVSVAYLESAYLMVMLMAVLQVFLRQKLAEQEQEHRSAARAARAALSREPA
jgi:hypothetical protein